jgi:hypothetical protein
MSSYPPIRRVSVIGFGSKARQGKDVAAAALAKEVTGARIYAFSDAISTYCRVAHGMKTRDPVLLQRVGLDARRSNPSTWIDALYWRIHEDSPKLALITGVRFPDEVQMIRDMGGKVWRIDRFARDGHRFVASDRAPDHPTETALDNVSLDTIIRNDGSLEDFRRRVVATYLEANAAL